MLGILRNKTSLYQEKIIEIQGVKFLEIDTQKNIKKAFKSFKKHNITKIVSKEKYDKYNIEYEDHFYLLSKKKYDIIKKLLKEKNSVFVYSKRINRDILEFIYFLSRVSDNIILDIGENTKEISEKIITEYGVAVLSKKLDYKNYNKIAIYFDKPYAFKNGYLVFNLSKEEFQIPSGISYISDIDFSIPNYNDDGYTDVKGICNILLKRNEKTFIEIKNIKIKA